MPGNNQSNDTGVTSEGIGQKSDLQPTSTGSSITLEDAKKEIASAIEEAKKEFLKKAKTEANEEIRRQVQTDKASLITVFGIFASMISFLTIEFQFLKSVCSFEKLLGFTLILASLLLCFNVALDYLVKSRTDYKTPKPNIIFGFFVVILFILGINFMYLGNEEICNDNKIYERYSENFENKQSEFNENFVSEQNKKNNKLETDIEDIRKELKSE